MCSTELSLDKRVKEIAFDPLNPARLSLITEEGELYLYKVERCGHLFSKLTRIVIGKATIVWYLKSIVSNIWECFHFFCKYLFMYSDEVLLYVYKQIQIHIFTPFLSTNTANTNFRLIRRQFWILQRILNINLIQISDKAFDSPLLCNYCTLYIVFNFVSLILTRN